LAPRGRVKVPRCEAFTDLEQDIRDLLVLLSDLIFAKRKATIFSCLLPPATCACFESYPVALWCARQLIQSQGIHECGSRWPSHSGCWGFEDLNLLYTSLERRAAFRSRRSSPYSRFRERQLPAVSSSSSSGGESNPLEVPWFAALADESLRCGSAVFFLSVSISFQILV